MYLERWLQGRRSGAEGRVGEEGTAIRTCYDIKEFGRPHCKHYEHKHWALEYGDGFEISKMVITIAIFTSCTDFY